MKNLLKLTRIEARLFFRDPLAWGIVLVLPTLLLLLLGALPALRTPQEVFGGERFIDLFAPSLAVISLATLGVNTLPQRLASQRERGELRRLSTTPAHPGLLLAAQLLIHALLGVAAILLLILAGNLIFAVPLPQNLPGFAAAFLLGLGSALSLGLLVGALAPGARAGQALAMPLFFLLMLLGGVYLPRIFLPKFLVQIGNYAPPGVQAMLDAWQGAAPDPLQLGALALITLLACLGAARFFRWE